VVEPIQKVDREPSPDLRAVLTEYRIQQSSTKSLPFRMAYELRQKPCQGTSPVLESLSMRDPDMKMNTSEA